MLIKNKWENLAVKKEFHNFHEFARSHRSIRKYKKKDISEELLQEILKTGVHASSSGNMQAYSIIVSRDHNIKKRMFDSHFKQSMLMDAPVFLTFCADFNRMRSWLEISDAPENFDNFMSFMIGAIDAILVSQNVALAAEYEGLGICYMGTTLASAHEIGPILNLPKNVVPIVGFSLGYPDEKPEERERLPLEYLVHQETYLENAQDRIQDCYDKKNREGMDRYRSIYQEMMEKENIQNLAQIYTKLKYTRESHLEYSQNLHEYLNAQNFLNFK